jgi:photosystem II stability/assembly factor-like uncharacterized protein
VPAGFVPYSATFTSLNDAWVLGDAPCATAPCTSLVRTRDGGRTWVRLPAPKVSLATPTAETSDPANAVRLVRFADPLHGWVFGGALYATQDGGQVWQRQLIGANGTSVLSLASDGSTVWAATGRAAAGSATSPVQLYTAQVANGKWRPVGSALPAGSAQITLGRDSSVWLSGTSQVWRLTGSLWKPATGVCPHNTALAAATAVDQAHADALCGGDGGAGSATYQLRGTTDGGAHWTSDGPAFRGPSWVNGLADNGSGVLLLASTSGRSVISRSSNDATFTTVTPLAVPTGGYPWTDLGFTTSSQAIVVLPRFGMWLSRDSGQSWTAVHF